MTYDIRSIRVGRYQYYCYVLLYQNKYWCSSRRQFNMRTKASDMCQIFSINRNVSTYSDTLEYGVSDLTRLAPNTEIINTRCTNVFESNISCDPTCCALARYSRCDTCCTIVFLFGILAARPVKC